MDVVVVVVCIEASRGDWEQRGHWEQREDWEQRRSHERHTFKSSMKGRAKISFPNPQILSKQSSTELFSLLLSFKSI